jgi:hypothetical protein
MLTPPHHSVVMMRKQYAMPRAALLKLSWPYCGGSPTSKHTSLAGHLHTGRAAASSAGVTDA